MYQTFSSSDELPTIFEGIWPSLIVTIGALVTLTILFFVVSWYAYFPVKEYLEKRKKFIQDNVDRATSLNVDAQRNFIASEEEIIKSKKQSETILLNSKQLAESQVKEILKIANDKAKKQIEQTHIDLINQENAMRDKLEAEFATIVMQASEKIVKEHLDKEKNKKIIDDFIKELEKDEK